MSLSNESGHDDRELVRHLLGQLADADAERLDELAIVDDEMAGRLRVVEDDLVDAYVRGTLEPDARLRFESHYLSSPLRREKVSFARTFVRHADAMTVAADARTAADAAAVTAGAPGWRDRFAEWLRPNGSSRWLVAAAALLLFGCAALLFEDLRLQRALTDAHRERTALDRRTQELSQQVEAERQAKLAADRELARARASPSAQAAQSTATSPESDAAPSASAPGLLALVLLPQTRGAGSVPTLTLPKSARGVAFALQLESNDFPHYQVSLNDPNTGRRLWRSTTIAPTQTRNQPTVSVVVPAGLLAPQHYSLELTGRGSTGDWHIISSYAVRIVSK
jgi:hypothetical protein